MPDIAACLAFVGAVLAMQVAPGPDMLLVVGRGVGHGRRTALLTVLGMTVVAGAVQLPLLALGIAAIVPGSPLPLDLLRWTGAAYLVWLGARLLLTAGGARGPAAVFAIRRRRLPAWATVAQPSLSPPSGRAFIKNGRSQGRLINLYDF